MSRVVLEGKWVRYAPKVDIPSVSDVKILLLSGVVVTRSSGEEVDDLKQSWTASAVKTRARKGTAQN